MRFAMEHSLRSFALGAILAATSLLHATPASAATLQVGPGKTYSTVRAAAQVAQNGDVVLIDAGVYSGDVTSWNASNLTVRGVGGRPHMRANGANEGGKGIWVVYGNNFTAENIEFSGSTVPDGNGAGIRNDTSGYLVVRNCYFHDNQNGILGGADSMLIEYSTFDHNGAGDGRTHNMYIWGRSVTVRYTYTHRASIGHNLKTRGQNNYILYNRIMDESDGTASYSIDVPDCGHTYIIGNVIEQGPASENSGIISYGAESSTNAQDLYVVNNTIVNNRSAGGTFLQVVGASPAIVRNNIFYGAGTPWSGGTVVAAGNYVEPAYNNSPRFAAPGSFDYHLTSASPASILNASLPAGLATGGFALTPSNEYVDDAQGRPRPLAGLMDLGAFEYSGPDIAPPAPISDMISR